MNKNILIILIARALRVFGFGAVNVIFIQFLLAKNLEEAEIRFVLDKDRYDWADPKAPTKQGNTVIHRSGNTAGLFPE